MEGNIGLPQLDKVKVINQVFENKMRKWLLVKCASSSEAADIVAKGSLTSSSIEFVFSRVHLARAASLGASSQHF